MPVAKIIGSAKFNSEGNFVVPISNDAPNYGMDISDDGLGMGYNANN